MNHSDSIHLKDDLLPEEVRDALRFRKAEREKPPMTATLSESARRAIRTALKGALDLTDAEALLRGKGYSRAFAWGAYDGFEGREYTTAGLVPSAVAGKVDAGGKTLADYDAGYRLGKELAADGESHGDH